MTLQEELMDMDARVKLWDAINDYTTACRGEPASHVYGNTPRQNAVAEVEDVIRAVEHAAEERATRAEAANELLRVQLESTRSDVERAGIGRERAEVRLREVEAERDRLRELCRDAAEWLESAANIIAETEPSREGAGARALVRAMREAARG